MLKSIAMCLASNRKRIKFKAVLFDLDGTLIEFKFRIRESRLAIIEWMTENGFDTSGLSGDTKTQYILTEVKNQCGSNEGRLIPFVSARKSISEILEKFEFQ